MRRIFSQTFPLVALLVVLFLLTSAMTALAQGTAFNYQGRLQDGGAPANGNYDLQFTLWDAVSGGTQQPQPSPVTVTRGFVAVANGSFTVQLDFGASAFPGADRFLEIGVRAAGGGAFAILSPRQQITSTPYAIRSASAGTADTATNATQLGSIAANQYVLTSDSRLSDSRPPTPGSANYIQNTTSQQASSNFNVSGNGTFGGTSTLIYPTSGSGGLFIRNRTNANYSQLVFLDDQGTYRGYTGYIGANAGLGSRNDTVELGSNGKDITFRPNESEVMRLTSGGNVGIGTTPTRARLETRGAIGNTVALFGGDGAGVALIKDNPYIGFNSYYNSGWKAISPGFGGYVGIEQGAGAMTFGVNPSASSANAAVAPIEAMRITQSGTVAIGTSNPLNAVLDVEGSGFATIFAISTGSGDAGYFDGTVRIIFLGAAGDRQLCQNSLGQISNCSSSLRYKKDVAHFAGGLDIINRLRPIAFTWKQGGMRDVGLAAEEVEKVEPLLTFRNDKGEIEGVKYNQLSAVFVNAFKEQQAQIAQQQEEIKQQHRQIESLKQLVCLDHPRANICKRKDRPK
jgi:hypothetical protein